MSYLGLNLEIQGDEGSKFTLAEQESAKEYKRVGSTHDLAGYGVRGKIKGVDSGGDIIEYSIIIPTSNVAHTLTTFYQKDYGKSHRDVMLLGFHNRTKQHHNDLGLWLNEKGQIEAY